jgi:hypothetical protein
MVDYDAVSTAIVLIMQLARRRPILRIRFHSPDPLDIGLQISRGPPVPLVGNPAAGAPPAPPRGACPFPKGKADPSPTSGFPPANGLPPFPMWRRCRACTEKRSAKPSTLPRGNGGIWRTLKKMSPPDCREGESSGMCRYSGGSNGSSPHPAEAVAHFGLATDRVMCHVVAGDSSSFGPAGPIRPVRSRTMRSYLTCASEGRKDARIKATIGSRART